MAGALILVATPIGNLGDLSERAVATLRSASVIACEDTRHTRKLLNHAEIRGVPVIAVHEHNEVGSAVEIVRRVEEGQTVALVTDAGMPAISDPGEKVVAAVAAAGLIVSVVPGPSAVPAALAVSGLPTERFCFEGFLPRKATDRQHRLADIADEERTMVLYEAPHRLAVAIDELIHHCGVDRRIVLVRELTKLHEEIWRGTLGALRDRLSAGSVKGECVLVLAGLVRNTDVSDDEILARLAEVLDAGGTKKDAVSKVVEETAAGKNRIYGLAAKLK